MIKDLENALDNTQELVNFNDLGVRFLKTFVDLVSSGYVKNTFIGKYINGGAHCIKFYDEQWADLVNDASRINELLPAGATYGVDDIYGLTSKDSNFKVFRIEGVNDAIQNKSLNNLICMMGRDPYNASEWLFAKDIKTQIKIITLLVDLVPEYAGKLREYNNQLIKMIK